MTSARDEPMGAAMLRAAAVAQAMEWFTRNRAGNLSPTETQAFTEWLHGSPLHVAEYLAAARLADSLPAVAARLRADRPEILQRAGEADSENIVNLGVVAAGRAEPQPAAQRGARWRYSLIAAALVLAACGGVLLWALEHRPGVMSLPHTVEVPHGEQRTLQLHDGSVAHLNTDTRIKVRYTKAERLIEFERGQALFQVARDPARPFRVKVGATEVVAVGTQFEIFKKAQGEVTLTVVEGKVDVLQSNRSDSATDKNNAAQRTVELRKVLRVQAGEQLKVGDLGAAPQASPVDVRIATAWMQREVIFNGRSLLEVAEEFNRYAGVPIVIDDPDLRELRVNGIFKAYDVNSFLGFLQQFKGIEVERERSVIRVRRRGFAAPGNSTAAAARPIGAGPSGE